MKTLMAGTHSSGEKKSKSSEVECPGCGSSVTVRDYQQSKIICESCGRVLKGEIKDRGPEWRAFDQEGREEKSRAGPPSTETIHDKGLSTQIDYTDRDARGNKLSPEQRNKIYRLRKWHKRTKVSGSTERNLVFAFSEMNRMASQLSLPNNVQEIASKIYRKAVQQDLIRGRSIEGCSSAALYAACRKAEMPRTLQEIAEASKVDKREIGRSYRLIARELDIDLPLTDPARYVARFGSEVNVSGEAKVEAMEIIRKAQEERLTLGKSPSGTAAAAIYIAALKCGERRTQREVAKVADVTEVTVRNRYKKIVEELNEEIKV
ncbi:transcription initiation factor IIB [candidate division MSBL1 archaeon SCGC-AAA259I09]|uniref:Transcription initiation factor IIB n=2 Tax=candidate division MSBL1 TaxID=215777 RepID=A0A133USM2_9EURY|nr:transcription initiation factor IIB [candidate division MSBL1 archaeon SCGC-AAA259E22]KXA97147.1 transcription initiation factor IIB [candidate division MSBL1 archaeon SCGC-AAA259I09]